MENEIIRIDIRDLMASQEVRSCCDSEYAGDVLVSMKDLYPPQKELVRLMILSDEDAEAGKELQEYDEELSGVVIDSSDEICTVVLCTYENNDIYIKKWIGDKKNLSSDAMVVIKGMMSVIMNDDRDLNMLCIENISKSGKSFLKMLM